MGKHQTNFVKLKPEERSLLERQTKSGVWKPREVIRALILLLADVNGPDALTDLEIAKRVGYTKDAVLRRRSKFAKTQSIEDTIFDRPRCGRPTIVDGTTEAYITKIACSTPPEGYASWSLKLIRNRVVSLEVVDNISSSTVGRVLKKKLLNLG